MVIFGNLGLLQLGPGGETSSATMDDFFGHLVMKDLYVSLKIAIFIYRSWAIYKKGC